MDCSGGMYTVEETDRDFCEFIEDDIKFNYCPMCGKKLKEEVKNEKCGN